MPILNYVEAHTLAIDLLKKAGFTMDHVARNTETVYMVHPAARPKLLRVSMHRFGGTPMGLRGVAACISYTATNTCPVTPTAVRNTVALTIGLYFLSEARESGYFGPQHVQQAKQEALEAKRPAKSPKSSPA